jgi:hypothetical protein
MPMLSVEEARASPAPQRERAADRAIEAGSWRADRHSLVVISHSRDRGTAMRDDAEDKEIVALLAQKLKVDRGAGVIAGTIRADQDGLDTAIDLSVHRCGPWHLLMAGSSLLEQAVELLAAMHIPPTEVIDKAELAIDLIATAIAGDEGDEDEGGPIRLA